MRVLLAATLLIGCNRTPPEPDEGVRYRPPGEDVQTGERGTVNISEIFWSGSVDGDGNRDITDVFIEFRNEGSFPVSLTGWRIVQEGAIHRTYRVPAGGPVLDVGEHGFVAAKDSGCFPAPDWVIPDLDLARGDAVEITLRDNDEHLIESAGSDDAPPYAGGYDGVRSRSMEATELMFGGQGTEPQMWHFYTPAGVDVPNNDRVAEGCRSHTLASPGRANSPDYSGAYASGSLE